MRKATCVLFLLALALLTQAGSPSRCEAVITDATIQDVQTGSVPDSAAYRLRGVIVVAIYNDQVGAPTSNGFWAQDPPSGGQGAQGDPFSGIFCYTRDPVTVAVGDSVTVVGTYIEFFEQSEIDVFNSLTISGEAGSTTIHLGGVVVPAPKKLTACVLGPDSLTQRNQPPMEQWEGVLVEVDTVRMKADLASGEWSVEEADGDSTCLGLADTCLVDDKNVYQQPPVGIVMRFLRGAFDETFAQHKIQPRGDGDIIFSVYPAPAPEFAYTTSNTTIEIRWTYPLEGLSAQAIGNYALQSPNFTLNSAVLVESTLVRITTSTQIGTVNDLVPEEIQISGVKNVNGTVMAPASVFFMSGVRTIAFIQEPKSGSNDSSRVAGFTVCTEGIVTCGTNEKWNSPGLNDVGIGTQFFIETPGGGQKSGVFVFNTSVMANVSRGDSVRVAGLIQEFNNKTEVGILDFVQVLGTGKPVPGPDVVTLANAHLEGYEGVLVRINGPLVTLDTWPGSAFNKIRVKSGTDTLTIDDLDGGGYPPPTIIVAGTTLPFLIGVMDSVRFTTPTPDFYRRILPRNLSDLFASDPTGVEEGGGIIPVRTRLESNVPNPFNPKTTIRFALSKPGQTSLVIYDTSGRLVRKLVDENMKVGAFAKTWDGRDVGGREVPSGIYFYKLVTTGFEETRKMVLLK